jgi:hypothetical protein
MEDDELKIALYLGEIINKLRIKAGLEDCDMDQEEDSITVLFEELLFLRIAFEFSKMYKRDRSQEYIDYLD